MYQNLLYAVKRRILDEVELAFQQHPAFSEKIKVYNKFPYNERIQYGIVLRNASASQIRLSPDNFMSDLFSHVRLARQINYPGLAIEWIRENEGNITEYYTEDVSSKVDPTQRQFYTNYPILEGPGNTLYADDPGQVKITINGILTIADTLNGETGKVLLPYAPSINDVVLIKYYKRKIVPPSVFIIDFEEDNQFYTTQIFLVENEIVISETTGTETTAQLDNTNIDVNSEILSLSYKNGLKIDSLRRGVDYTLNNVTGLITFLNPLLKNYSIIAEYQWRVPNTSYGPYTFKPYQEIHDAVTGVVISIGRRAKKGDQQVVIVSQNREQQAQIFGGHWEVSLEIGVISKDSIQMEEMTDHIISQLWGVRKNILEYEGLTLNSVEPSGESEEVHIETTGDLYYESTVSINLLSEWQSFVPYLALFKIRNIYVIPDMRAVLKGPIVGYEKLT